MTKGTKVILSVILFGGIGAMIYLKVKQNKAENKDGGASGSSTPSDTTKKSDNISSAPAVGTDGSTKVGGPQVSGTDAPVAADPRTGKIANAKFDNTPVYNKDGSKYKTAKKGEWIGTVSGVSNGRIWVEGGTRYVFDTTIPSITTNFTGK